MPKELIKKYLPDPEKIKNNKSLAFLGPIIHDPNLWHLNRHSVSLAMFVGIFCAFIPLPIQSLLVIAMCFWLGANLPLAMLIIWMSNPLTIPPMFFLTYKLGSLILGTELGDFSVTLTWEWFSQLGSEILLPLFVGSLLCGTVLASIGYFFVLFLWRWRVVRNWEQRKDARQADKKVSPKS